MNMKYHIKSNNRSWNYRYNKFHHTNLAWSGGGVLCLDESEVGKNSSYNISFTLTRILEHGLISPGVSLSSGSGKYFPSFLCHWKYSHLVELISPCSSTSVSSSLSITRGATHPVEGGKTESVTHLMLPLLSPSDSLTLGFFDISYGGLIFDRF